MLCPGQVLARLPFQDGRIGLALRGEPMSGFGIRVALASAGENPGRRLDLKGSANSGSFCSPYALDFAVL